MLAACTTTHPLGRIDDPATHAQLNALAAEGVDYVHLRTETPTNRPPFGYRFSGIDPAGVLVEPARGQSLVVPLSQVQSVSRYDRWRGARQGAIAGGIFTFVATIALVVSVQSALNSGCADGCDKPDAGWKVLPAGAIGGVIGAVVGGALGAAVGYEDRYVITPP